MDGVVAKKKKTLLSYQWVRAHMVLTDQPRLFLMTEFDMDEPAPQKYRKDILMYPHLQAVLVKRNRFAIKCPMSNKILEYQSDSAGKWVTSINNTTDKMLK